ncbi:putative KIN, antigenic determinant of recA protein [Triangularia setosa]|uniref:KIN, antigenic determinant of recA protein n=1 Tax=Triangularia setosa TaxID=2587417 RepID=A0AAN6WC00_9PEZI|nr:putative KIN, antigenic determinant of recA protein [Podospora setosa]
MGKAEVGSTKYLSNKMKQKGLTRLRWFCQICEKACRDENAFKMHCQSESHTRRALSVGQNIKQVTDDYSRAFQQEFISLLKTSHGEKEIHANKFYQEVIAKKDHVHLNATKWHSLTEFVKYIGREGICRVVEKEDGLFIAWIDDSPEAMRRREAVRRKEMMDKGDEEREMAVLRGQIERARKEAEQKGVGLEREEKERELKRGEGEKIKLDFGGGKKAESGTPTPTTTSTAIPTSGEEKGEGAGKEEKGEGEVKDGESKPAEAAAAAAPAAKVSLKFGAKPPAAKNVFKNALSGAPKKVMVAQPKKMSAGERIMMEELERKRAREARGSGGDAPNKRPRF